MARVMMNAIRTMHEARLVHTDLKPDNILVMRDPVRRDFVKVVDFGIARIRIADAEDEITASGTTLLGADNKAKVDNIA